MNVEVEAFIGGYMAGLDGKPPPVPSDIAERGNEDLSSETPLGNHAWIWRIIGWTSGQAVALHEMAR